jgi:hypothetical protein
MHGDWYGRHSMIPTFCFMQVFDTDGWRVAMRCVSAVSFMVGVSVAIFASDPRLQTPTISGFARPPAESQTDALAPFLQLPDKAATGSGRTALHRSAAPSANNSSSMRVPMHATGGAVRMRDQLHNAWISIYDIMQLKTFQIIVAQGIVGTMPWNAIAFITLWLQLLGFPNWHASVLTAAFYGATSAGSFLGGAIGDAAAACFPTAGRIYTAQTSVCNLSLVASVCSLNREITPVRRICSLPLC